MQALVHVARSARPFANRRALALPRALHIRSPPVSVRSSPRPLRCAAALVFAAAALAGCGSSPRTGSAGGPASAIPATVPLYLEATVRPGGALKTDALAAGRTLTHQANPYLKLLAALQTPGSSTLDFTRDVAPWLGDHAAIFLSSLDASNQLLSLLQQDLLGSSPTASASPFAAKGLQGAIVLDTRDVAKARSFLAAQARRAGARATAYRGVPYYQAPSSGVALGIVHRFAVIGSEAGLHSVIDTTLGGASLAQTTDYTKLLAAAPSGALGHLYTNPGASPATGSAQPNASGVSGAGDAAQPGGPSGPASLLPLLAGARQANLSLVPSATSLTLDDDALASHSADQGGGLLSAGAAGVHALGELPAESWLAVGLGEVATTLSTDVQGLNGLLSLAGPSTPESSAAGFTAKGILEGILAPLSALSADSAEARSAFQSWMGSAGLFASGTGVVELRAGLAIVSHNPASSRAAVAKLAAILERHGGSAQTISIPGTDAAISARVSGLPVELDIADGRASDGQTKFVIGLGEASVQDALAPSRTLASSATLGSAATALGEGAQPSLIVNFPMLLGLLEGVGLSEDPTISPLLPYLRTLTTLAGAGHSLDGGVERLRLVLGLQQTG
jgi:Protein of unknown function (DUF3352)